MLMTDLLGPVNIRGRVAGSFAPQLDVLPLLDHEVAVQGVGLDGGRHWQQYWHH